MKKKLIIASFAFFFAGGLFANAAAPKPEKEIRASFALSFPGIKDAKWNKLDDYYQVYFKTPERVTRLMYDTNGNLVQSLENYDGNLLPTFIKVKLSHKYPNKSITGVTELTTPNSHFYQIILEDEKHSYKIMSSSEGELRLESKLKKT